MRNADAALDDGRLSGDTLPRLLVLFFLLTIAASLECLKLSAFREPEIWGHLRSGMWILQNKAWPQSGLFSQSNDLPWRDFSWGSDVVAAVVFRVAGLRALPALLVGFRFSLAIVTFLLAGGWRNFWPAAGLSAAAQYVLFAMSPTPACVSVILFGAELLVLLNVRESRDVKLWKGLPLLFLLWANLDLGFVYGIVLYVVFLAALLVEKYQQSRDAQWFGKPGFPVPLRAAFGSGAACFLASLLNPYTFHAYTSFWANEFGPANHNLPGYTAMGFRQPRDYVLMLLGMSAYLALGLLRSRDLFPIGALAGCTALAFYEQRGNWLLALVSVAVIGRAVLQKRADGAGEGLFDWNIRRAALLTAAFTSLFVVFIFRVPSKQDVLLGRVAETFPVRAADYLRGHPQPSPFFNVERWGGFLAWYLPEYPVAIDSRRGLYPEEMEASYFKVMNADIPLRDFPPMNQARTLVMDKAGIMGQALRGVSGFQVLYEDDIAIVYSHETKE